MTTVSEIPTIPEQPQTMSITLGGTVYQLTLVWNVYSESWVLDLADADDVDLIVGVPLVTGSDLLEQMEYLGLGGQLIVQTDADRNAVPTFENLGTNGHLYWISP